MKKSLLSLALLCSVMAVSAQKPIKLFNGKNLDGWGLFTKEIATPTSQVFSVQDKVIDLAGPFGYMYTEGKYSNYELEFEWRWTGEGSNSGVFIHMADGLNKAWPSCFEIQLQSGSAGNVIFSGEVNGNEFDGKKRQIPGYKKGLEKPLGEWNYGKVICFGDKIEVFINGEKQNEITGLSHSEGYVGLQSEGKRIQFRNVILTK